MIFRLKTSKRTQEIFQELENRTNYKPYTLVKHAIAWSIRENTSVADYVSDSEGLDLNRQTITGGNESYFKVLIETVEGAYGVSMTKGISCPDNSIIAQYNERINI